MALTLRNTKGSPLTATEMDNNLTYLETVGVASGSIDIFTGSVAYPNINKIKVEGAIQASNVSGVVTLSVVGAVGSSGTDGTSGTSGATGSTGTAGSSGTAGSAGSGGTSGTSGGTGSTGSAGSSGTSGQNGDRFASTSTTSHDLTSGAKTFTIDTGLQWTPGQQTIISKDGSNYMAATVTSYNSGTGQFVVNVTSVTGSGTGITSWYINTAGATGQAGSGGTSGTTGSAGTSGESGTSGTSATGVAGSSGTSGAAGGPGAAGSSGTSGSSSTSGTSATSGTTGTTGSAGTSSTAGSGGTSGTSGGGGASFPYDGRTTPGVVTGSLFVSGTFYVTGSSYSDALYVKFVKIPTSSADIKLDDVNGFSAFSASVDSRITAAGVGGGGGGNSIFAYTSSTSQPEGFGGAFFNAHANIGVVGRAVVSGALSVLGTLYLNTGSLISSSNQVNLENITGFNTFSSSILTKIGAGGLNPIAIEYNATPLIASVENINFTGPGVIVTNASSSITVTITTGSASGGVSGSAGSSGTSGTSAQSALLTIKSSIQEFVGIASLTFSGSGVTLNPSGSNGVEIGITGGGGGSGLPGSNGTSGTSGSSGASGSSGISGTQGTSGTAGTSGVSGTGIAGTSGVDGSHGTSGLTGTNGSAGTSIQLTVKDDGGITTIGGITGLTFSGSFTLAPSGSGGVYVGMNSNINVTGAPGGTVSGSQQLLELGFARTASNSFNGTQLITGSVFVTGAQVTLSGSVWAQSLQLPYSWSLILPLQEGFMLAGSPQGYLTAIRTSSLSGVGSSNSGGPFTQTGSYYSAVSDILISGSLKVSGSISASAFAITTPGIPEIASSTDIILNAANSVKISSSSLRLASFTDSQTGSIVAENGSIIYNSTKNKIGAYIDGQWVHDGGLFPYVGNASFAGSLISSGTNTFIGNNIVTGSFNVSGSTVQVGNNTLTGTTILSGSIFVSGSTHFQNTTMTVTGSSYFTGSMYVDGDFYKARQKQFNYISLANTGSVTLIASTLYSASFIDGTSPLYKNNGMYLSGSVGTAFTKIVFEHSGIYNIQYSIQMDTTDNQPATLYVWLAKDGTDISYSNSLFGVPNNGYSVGAANFVQTMEAGSYVELRYATQNSNLELATVSSSLVPVRPISPAIIATITQVA